MKTWATLTVAVLTAAGLMGPAGAIAGPTQCTGTLSGPVSGEVVVPPGASCTIQDATISGNVKVEQGASLEITAITTISGNVKGKNCASINVTDPDGLPNIVIGGDLSAEGCEAVSCEKTLIGKNFTCKNGITCNLTSCTVGNNVECSGNIGGSACNLLGNQIGGDVKVNNNSIGIITVGNDRIAGNLKCDGNAGTLQFNNIVAGTRSGQCDIEP